MLSDQEYSGECLKLPVEQHSDQCQASGIDDDGDVMTSVTEESLGIGSSTHQCDMFSTIQATLSADLVEQIAAKDKLSQLYQTVKACLMEPVHLVASGTVIVVGFRTNDLCRLECKLQELVSDKQTILCCNDEMPPRCELDEAVIKPSGAAFSVGTESSKSPVKRSAGRRGIAKISTITRDNELNTGRNSSVESVHPPESNISTTDSRQNLKSIVEKCNNLSAVKCRNTARKRGRPSKSPVSRFNQPSDVQHNSADGTRVAACADHEYATPDEHVTSCPATDEQEHASGTSNNSDDAVATASDFYEHSHQSEKGKNCKNKLQATPSSRLNPITKSQTYESRMPYAFLCTECSFRAKRKGHLLRHLMAHVRGLPVLHCSKCSYSTLSPTHLSRHLTNVHSAATKFTCSVDGCTYQGNSSQRLRRHMSMHHSDKAADRLLLHCPIPGCSYQAMSEKRLERHATTKHRKIEDDTDDDALVIPLVARFHCSKCDYETNHRSHFLRHRSSLHGNVCPFLCDTCGQRFKRKDGLVAHSLLHTTSDRNSFKFCCKTCGHKFRSQSNLTNHQAFHSTARPHICELCGKTFKSHAERRKHVKMIHERPRSFQCTICGVSVSTPFALQRHSVALHGVKSSPVAVHDPQPCLGTQTMEIAGEEKTLVLEELLRNQSSD